MPFIPPKPTLSVTSMALTVEEARKLMWDEWSAEVIASWEAESERILSGIPSLREDTKVAEL